MTVENIVLFRIYYYLCSSSQIMLSSIFDSTTTNGIRRDREHLSFCCLNSLRKVLSECLSLWLCVCVAVCVCVITCLSLHLCVFSLLSLRMQANDHFCCCMCSHSHLFSAVRIGIFSTMYKRTPLCRCIHIEQYMLLLVRLLYTIQHAALK